MSSSSALDRISHIVVLMLENRSFDHMLGYLPDGDPNYPPNGQSFEGLSGKESNPDSKGTRIPVVKITSEDFHQKRGTFLN